MRRPSIELSVLCGVVAFAGGVPSLGGARAQDAPASSEGQSIFAGTCSGCHGNDLAGGRGPSLFNDRVLARLDDAAIRATILNGVSGSEMPAFKGTYNDAQIASITAYLRARGAQLRPPPGAYNLAAPFVPAVDGARVHSEHQDFRLEIVARDLDTPWGMDFLPDGRLLVTERSPARLRIIDASGKLLPAVEGLPAVHVQQDGGLLDVAVGPDFARDGWVYISYSDDDPQAPEPTPPPPGTSSYLIKRKPSMTVIARGKIDATNHWTQQQDLFRMPFSAYTASGAHYGSRFLFDGKGHLFFSLGERGDMKNAQNLASPLGKIHRINLDGSIPADNPFVGRKDAVASIWSYGHRNAEGLAIDPATGLVWESEHGPNGGDEINIIAKGHNYGWGVTSMGEQPGITKTSAPGMDQPVAWFYPTIAPSGIAFYEGNRYPAWKGSLFVTGLRGQQLRRLSVRGNKVVSQEVVIDQLGRVRDVATGPDGLLYLIMTNPTGPGTGLDLSAPVKGEVVRLVPIKWEQPQPRRTQ
jgi:glucose/arabinose dehydrogenase